MSLHHAANYHTRYVSRVQTLIVVMNVQGREQRGEAAAAVPIRSPTVPDLSIPLPSSGGGPR
jgi:hypothetical protein